MLWCQYNLLVSIKCKLYFLYGYNYLVGTFNLKTYEKN